MRVLEAIVDVLPERAWKPANLYMVPGGDLHFCVGKHPRLDRSVRTIEWRGREIAHGHRPFDYAIHEERDDSA